MCICKTSNVKREGEGEGERERKRSSSKLDPPLADRSAIDHHVRAGWNARHTDHSRPPPPDVAWLGLVWMDG